mmetsp:Transcript_44454/g.80502  ORF Transcript_44454/g.80502 Transcript_44454/m.80502 type:complete len:145 (-) Transcript_44454:394-828(-)
MLFMANAFTPIMYTQYIDSSSYPIPHHSTIACPLGCYHEGSALVQPQIVANVRLMHNLCPPAAAKVRPARPPDRRHLPECHCHVELQTTRLHPKSPRPQERRPWANQLALPVVHHAMAVRETSFAGYQQTRNLIEAQASAAAAA